MNQAIEVEVGKRKDATLDVSDEAVLRRWAKRLCVTPNELREILEENGDRLPPALHA